MDLPPLLSLFTVFYSICGVTRVDTDEVTLLNYLREPQNRVQYDKLSNKTYVVEEINDDLMIGKPMISFLTQHQLFLDILSAPSSTPLIP